MRCKFNGSVVEIKDGTTIGEFLVAHKLIAEQVVVEYNKEVLARGAFETTRLTEGDQLEILSFVGGG